MSARYLVHIVGLLGLKLSKYLNIATGRTQIFEGWFWPANRSFITPGLIYELRKKNKQRNLHT
jgi:hypothetical protein